MDVERTYLPNYVLGSSVVVAKRFKILMHEGAGRNLPTASTNVTFSNVYVLSKITWTPLTYGEGEHRKATWAYNQSASFILLNL